MYASILTCDIEIIVSNNIIELFFYTLIRKINSHPFIKKGLINC